MTTRDGLEAIRQRAGKRLPEQSTAWKAELRALKLAYIKANTPAAYEASGGDTMKLKPWEDRTTNGLTRCILDYLTLQGHYAVRINTQGQARVKKMPRYNLLSGQIEYREKVSYTKSMTAKGTPDVDAVINGRAVKIEVKAGRDRLRPEQISQGQKIEAAGGIYFVATDMPAVIAWYKQFIENPMSN